MSDLGNSLDIPFEEGGEGEMSDDPTFFSGGVIVMASVVDVPDVGKKPALVFRFAKPEGGFYVPMVLVADDDQIANLVPLVTEAAHTARRAASRPA